VNIFLFWVRTAPGRDGAARSEVMVYAAAEDPKMRRPRGFVGIFLDLRG